MRNSINISNQLTSGSTRNYEWDHADRMSAYYNQTGTSEPTVYAHYFYDASGQRVKKMVRNTGGGIDTIVYIDGIFEYRTDGTNTQNLIHIMDDQSRIARFRMGHHFDDGDTVNDPFITYNIEDHLGSSSIRMSITATVVDREEYYPFGDSSLRTWTKKRYRYTGKEKDAESGLYYYGARYYAAWTGRFISVDPLAADYPFYTPYNYAGNKPIGKVDIDGMQEENAAKGPPSGGNVPPLEPSNMKSGGTNNTTAKTEVNATPKEMLSKISDPNADTQETDNLTVGGINEAYMPEVLNGPVIESMGKTSGMEQIDFSVVTVSGSGVVGAGPEGQATLFMIDQAAKDKSIYGGKVFLSGSFNPTYELDANLNANIMVGRGSFYIPEGEPMTDLSKYFGKGSEANSTSFFAGELGVVGAQYEEGTYKGKTSYEFTAVGVGVELGANPFPVPDYSYVPSSTFNLLTPITKQDSARFIK